jgi:NAD(P)-dependent dehydrogenase (short-subunit alcohol dehydrogenase family)
MNMANEGADAPVAFVSGAGSGIGRATCLELAGAGYRVWATDLNGDAAQQTVDMIAAAGGAGYASELNVQIGADVEAMGARIADRFGRLDAAVNSAGITPPSGLVQDVGEDEWQLVLDVNVIGVWRCMAMQIPLMLQTGGGSIVNISSRTGLSGSPGRASYSASKHAVIGLTRSAALELAPHGIRVNAVCPGPIATAMLDSAGVGNPERRAKLAASSAMNRIGEAEEVVAAIAWLLSSAASYITGVELPIDGGQARGHSAFQSGK